MAQNDCAGSLQVCRLRVARLNADGSPDTGDNNMYVTDTLISLGATPQVVAGEDMSLVNGCGEPVVQHQDEDKITRLNLTASLAKPDPDLVALLTGATLITDGGDSIGFQYPALNSSVMGPAVSIEAWSKAIVNGKVAVDLPWWRWVYPFTEWRLADAPTLENAPLALALTGRALENTEWGNGPANDWAYASDRVLNVARDETANVPDASCGAVAVPAS